MSSSSPPASSRRPSWTDDLRSRSEDTDRGSGLRVLLAEGTLLARKYRLKRPAGFGGMAQLWVATNESTGAEVCVKVLVPSPGDDSAVERFRREANAAARLNHRAIVRVFDLLELAENGDAVRDEPPVALAIVMELLHGETLGDAILKRGKLTLEETLDIAIPVLSALARAHRAGVIHRDVKPDNVFLASDAEDGDVAPKVLDFGVSKMTATTDGRGADDKPLTLDGAILGTPSFMSPEQVKDDPRSIDARTDVFSAGIVIHMMLTGKNPFDSPKVHSVVSAIMELDPPRPPGLPDEIWTVLSRMLEKDRSKRYNDATEAGIALRRAAGRTSTTDSGAQQLPKAVLDVMTTVQPTVDSPSAAPPDDAGAARDSRPASSPKPIVLALVVIAAVIALVALVRETRTRASDATSRAPSPVTPLPSALGDAGAARPPSSGTP